MKKKVKYFFLPLGVLVVILLLAAGFIYSKMTGVGVGRGAQRAEACQECHPDQYEEWHQGQLAAFAAVQEPFLAGQAEEFAGFACWKCHDPYKLGLDEGVTCEYCHGISGTTEEEGHEVYAARREALIDESYCHQCHQVCQPITKADLQGTVGEWQESNARKEGLTCQKCHMPLIGDGDEEHHFHGHYYPGRNPLPGRKSLSIESIEVQDGQISVWVKNHVSGHYLPSGAFTKALFLEVKGFPAAGEPPVFEDQYIFVKRFHFKKVLGIQEFPFTVSRDTRLEPEELREINFLLDESMEIAEVRATLRFAFVGDFHLEPEYYTSDYLAEEIWPVEDEPTTTIAAAVLNSQGGA